MNVSLQETLFQYFQPVYIWQWIKTWQSFSESALDWFDLSIGSPHGDQTQEQYSSRGRTYVLKALTKVRVSLETKHLCIRFALAWALATIPLICVWNFKPLLRLRLSCYYVCIDKDYFFRIHFTQIFAYFRCHGRICGKNEQKTVIWSVCLRFCLSVCLSVSNTGEPCKTAELIGFCF